MTIDNKFIADFISSFSNLEIKNRNKQIKFCFDDEWHVYDYNIHDDIYSGTDFDEAWKIFIEEDV